MVAIRGFAALAVVLMMNAATPAQQTVIFVRHAEKENGSGDVSISAAGRRRADNLVRVLKDAGLDAIVTSDTRRARQTAEPLAKSLQISPKSHEPTERPDATAKRLTGSGSQCILVVGHSNTVPVILDAVTGKRNNVLIADDEFDAILIATRKPDGSWSLIRAKY